VPHARRLGSPARIRSLKTAADSRSEGLPDLRRLKDDHQVVERWAKLEQAGQGDEWAFCRPYQALGRYDLTRLCDIVCKWICCGRSAMTGS
jgi:hypothetical protein